MTEPLTGTKRDLCSLAELEKRLFSDPWSQASLAAHLASPYALAIGVRKGETLCAYGLFQILGEEGEVLRIGTRPDCARQGLATAILHAFGREAEKAGAKRLFLEVRSRNEKAKGLYEKEGFVTVGTRKGYYKDPADDALIYQKKLKRSLFNENSGL